MHIKITNSRGDATKHAFIRQANLEDAEQLHRLDMGLAAEIDIDIPLEATASVSDHQRTIVKALSNSLTSIFLVADVEGRIVGSLRCLGVRQKSFRHVTMLDIAIHKDFRGQGIGSALMSQTIAWAMETSTIKRIELFVYCSNEAAIKLYKKFGFVIEGRRDKGLCHRGRYVDYYLMALSLF